MAYEMVMPYHLHMPSYFLETFTEYPYLSRFTPTFKPFLTDNGTRSKRIKEPLTIPRKTPYFPKTFQQIPKQFT